MKPSLWDSHRDASQDCDLVEFPPEGALLCGLLYLHHGEGPRPADTEMRELSFLIHSEPC